MEAGEEKQEAEDPVTEAFLHGKQKVEQKNTQQGRRDC